jgi:rhamnogalacturonan endolyase
MIKRAFLLPGFLVLAVASVCWAENGSSAGVAVTEDATSFTLSNGIVTAHVSKTAGDLTSLQYNGTEILTDQSGRAGAYWSHDASGGTKTLTQVTIDPKSNDGARGEVSVKGISGGKKMGHPAGGAADGDFPADIEIRYSLGRGDSGIYTYCILDHLPAYPAGSIGEARYCAKLASMFDWLQVDARRNKYYPREEPGEDKYVYTAVQSENLAYGWSSSTRHIGAWIVNPTIEYLSGGPTKVEFLCHRDTTQVQAPCILNYWRSSHYGGAAVGVAQGEHWTKVIGPFLIYVNSGGDPQALWHDARAQAEKESAKWPYDWVDTADYPSKSQRGDVSGQFILNDPLMPGGARFVGTLTVGLTGPEWDTARATSRPSRHITWQTDAKYYQFWTKNTDKTGHFSIPNVRPGKYVLHAFADGIIGEFTRADINIEPGGKPVDLGNIEWSPVRHGKEIWTIGTPNRTATEFANGDKYFEPDTQLQYPKLFPNDVRFVIGQSDPAKDWYFEHIPHNENPKARVRPFFGVPGNGRATPYSIVFDIPTAPAGKATLRFAICSASAKTLDVSVNDTPAGSLENLNFNGDATITRHNIQGIWFERELSFDAKLLKQGTNTITLTIPEGPLNAGIIYDCVRLELDDSTPTSTESKG